MNKVMLIGNVGKEPDVRYYEANQAVAQLSLATTERGYTLQNGTQVPDHTDWHNLVFYHKMAQIVERYVHKGDKLYIEGRIRYRSYDDKQGRRHYVTEIWKCYLLRIKTQHRQIQVINQNNLRPSSLQMIRHYRFNCL